MSSLSRPDEVLSFPNHMSIEINYKNTKSYAQCKSYDAKCMTQGHVWHQIVVIHKGIVGAGERSKEILNAVFAAVDDEEFYPVAYRYGEKEDRFLVRQCKPALDKLFAKKLRIKLSNRTHVSLKVQFNVATYKFGQIAPATQIALALNTLFNSLECIDSDDGILNVSKFSSNQEFFNVVVNLGNLAVFERVCSTIYNNDEKFRTLNGLLLRENGISSFAPLKIFGGIEFTYLDLRDNQLRSAKRFCQDLKDVKALKLYLAGNPLLNTSKYPESLNPIIKNFKMIDDIPIENLSKHYTPMDYEVDSTCDGYRIDWSNKKEMAQFESSEEWHAIMVPDIEQEYTKDSIFDFFFIQVSPNYSDIFPCYYKFSNGEHQFLVRQCFDQLQHLVDNCNLEITVPRLVETSDLTTDADIAPQVEIAKTLVFYIRMNISPFKCGQVEPMASIEKALDLRFSIMDRKLNLDNFQSEKCLENIVLNTSSPKLLGRILQLASRKFVTNCIELHLRNNKIFNANIPKVLMLMSNLKAIDLGNNWIQKLEDIKELQELSLKTLRLDGNPLCRKYSFAAEYIKAVRTHFPELTTLDNVDISRGILASQKNYLCDLTCYDLVEEFLTRFFSTYDSKKDRLNMKDVYHPQAIFTMTCSYTAAHSTTQNFSRISKYLDPARNILKMSDFSRAHTSVHVGSDEIMRLFSVLPAVAHDTVAFRTDTTVHNDNMTVITVNGVFMDQADSMIDTDMLMAFSRTFVLTPVARNLGILKCGVQYQIVNEQLNVFNPTPTQIKQAFKYVKADDENEQEEVTAAGQETLLVMLQQVTRLKSVWCNRCLVDANWDFKKALEKFLELCERGEVPETAFITDI